MNWERAESARIDDTAYYLVKDNGYEWHDFDLSVQKGYVVRGHLQPTYVRGRPEWIAKIIRPVGVVGGSGDRGSRDLSKSTTD